MSEGESASYGSINESKDSLYYALDDENEPRAIVTPFAKAESFTPLLDQLLASYPKGADTLNQRWSLVRSYLFHGKPQDDLSLEMAKADFQDTKDPMMNQLKPFLNGIMPVNPDLAGMLCCFFLLFRDTQKGIFYTMLPTLEDMMNKITVQQFFQITGPESLSFFPHPDIEFYKKCTIDSKSLALYFQYPVNYQYPQFSIAMQDRFLKEFSYPNFFPQSSIHLSFAHLAIQAQKHYIDLMKGFFIDYLHKNNPTEVPEILQDFIDLVPYVICANTQMVTTKIERYSNIINQDFHNENINELFHRLGNDSKLAEFISFIRGDDSTISTQELAKQSLPFHLQYSLGNNEILDWQKLKYYAINDMDGKIDFDFLTAYKLFQTFLRSFKAPSKVFKEKFEEMKGYLESLSSQNLKNALVLDLFSAIFIKQNDKYVCHPFVAQEIINLLNNYKASPYISGAAIMFQRSPVTKKDQHKTLEFYFEKDHKQIYAEILAQNWTVADQMTAFIPYYRKVFNRAYARYLIVNRAGLPEHLEKDKALIIMEIGFSTPERIDYLVQSITQFPKYTKCLQNRVDMLTTSCVLEPMPNPNKWSKAIVSLTEVPSSLEEVVASNKFQSFLSAISPSNNLYEFLSYLSLYFQCASLYTGREYGSINEIFRLDIRRAIAGPYNIGDMGKVNQLVEKYKIDLFSFVLQNINWFNINVEFIAQIYPEHPLEAIALAATKNNFDMVKDKELSKPITNYLTKTTTYEKKFDQNDEISKILKLVQSNSTDYDDILFRVDHNSLYNRLLRFDNTKFNDSMIKLLDVVDYVAPPDDKDVLEKIRIFNKIIKFTTSNSPNFIIDDLLNQNRFDMAMIYLKRCVSADSRAQPLCHLFSKCLDDGEKMDTIIENFSSRYDLISSRFFHIPGVLPHLLKCCPPEKREQIKGLSLLPEEVATDSNIFDIVTVAESFGRHIDCIFTMTQETAGLFTDEQLLSIVNSVEEDRSFYPVFTFVYKFFKGKDAVLKILAEKIIKSIVRIDVDSQDLEEDTIQFFRDIERAVNVFPHESHDYKVIRVVSDIVTFQPFTRFGIKYSFRDFHEDTFAHKLLDICNIIDRDDIARGIRDAFFVDISSFIIRRVQVQMQIGLIKQIKSEFEIDSCLIDEHIENGSQLDACISFLTPLIKIPIFDPQTVKKFKNLQVSQIANTQFPDFYIYQWIKMQKKGSLYINKKGHMALKFLIYKFFNDGIAISLSVAFMNPYFRVSSTLKLNDAAYQILNRIDTDRKKNHSFIHDIFYSSVCYDSFKSINRYIINQDTQGYITKDLWTSLIDFLKDNEMNHTLFTIYSTRNMYDEAALVSLELFHTASSLSSRLSFISHAAYCLNEGIHYRKDMTQPDGCPYRPLESKSTEDLERLREMVKFQLDLTQFCTESQIEFTNDYNLLRSEESAIKVGANLLMNNAYDLLDELTQMAHISQKDILEQVAIFLSEKNLNDLLKFLAQFRTYRYDLAQILQPQLLDVVAKGPHHSYLLYLIMSCWNNAEDQCLYFIAYDYIAEAFAISSTKGLKHLLPLIAYRASQLGKTDMVENCINNLPSK